MRNHAPLKSQKLVKQSRIKNQQSKIRIKRNKNKTAVIVSGCRHKATSGKGHSTVICRCGEDTLETKNRSPVNYYKKKYTFYIFLGIDVS